MIFSNFSIGPKEGLFLFNRAKRGLLFLCALLPEENELGGTRAIGRDLYLQPGRRVPGKEGST